MKNPILVTGSHRSGSTWVGKVLSQSPEVFYIHEPFNIGIERKNVPLKYWFEHIAASDDFAKQKTVLKYIHNFYGLDVEYLFKKALSIRSLSDSKKYVQNISTRLNSRPLIKDPIAIMSAEWLYQQTNCDVVIVIRHPAAFIASLKVINWPHDFCHFEQQHSLLSKYLPDYNDEIINFAHNEHDIIAQGILLWNIIYSTVWQYFLKYERNWCFVRHEDISKNPITAFEEICEKINIKFSGQHKAYIAKTTSAKDGISTLVRDSEKNIHSWQNRLTIEEIIKIKEKTASVWKHFYTEDDWELKNQMQVYSEKPLI